MKDIKFFIESMTFCQGNCHGCFFSKDERVNGAFIKKEKLDKILSQIRNYLADFKEGVDATIIFGQGDHLSISMEDLDHFLNSLLILKDYNRLVVFTTSAVLNTNDLINKLKKIDAFVKEHKFNIIPGVVVDVKKMLHPSFYKTYLKNIEILRDFFGVLDLTINIGDDTIEYFTPNQLKEFLIKNNFRHIEFNLIPTKTTINSFDSSWNKIIDWVSELNKELLNEIEVFHMYHYQQIKNERNGLGMDLDVLLKYIQDTFKKHIYVNKELKVIPAASGFLGNAIPYHEKITDKMFDLDIVNLNQYENMVEQFSKKILSSFFKNKSCNSCKFLNKCVDSGSDVFRNILNYSDSCFSGAFKVFESLENQENKSSGMEKILTNKNIKSKYSFGSDSDIKVKFNEH